MATAIPWLRLQSVHVSPLAAQPAACATPARATATATGAPTVKARAGAEAAAHAGSGASTKMGNKQTQHSQRSKEEERYIGLQSQHHAPASQARLEP